MAYTGQTNQNTAFTFVFCYLNLFSGISICLTGMGSTVRQLLDLVIKGPGDESQD